MRNRTAGVDPKSPRHVSLAFIPSKHFRWHALVDLAAHGMPVACDMTPRILIADDQPDLLDALKLLLKGEGIEYDAVTSPDAAVAALDVARVRSRADGSELHRRHDVGARRDRSAVARAGASIACCR